MTSITEITEKILGKEKTNERKIERKIEPKTAQRTERQTTQALSQRTKPALPKKLAPQQTMQEHSTKTKPPQTV